MSCSSVCHQLDSWSVFAYPKQRATVLVGSVLKWRARPQCLHRQLKCLRVSKTESYGLSRICFEMTRQATMPSSKAWLCLADEQHICRVLPIVTNEDAFMLWAVSWCGSAGSWGRLGRYINCNFRRRFFVSLAFRFNISHQNILNWSPRGQFCFYTYKMMQLLFATIYCLRHSAKPQA
jgi:hypothetical protein